MTSKKKSATKRPLRNPFAATPREAYLLAAAITDAGRYFGREARSLRAVVAAASERMTATSKQAEAFARDRLDELKETRKVFESMLLVDPAAAVRELGRIRREILDVRGVRAGRAGRAESAALGRAVNHVAEWLRRRQRGEDRGFAMPVATLEPISRVRPIRNEQELEALARSGPVRRILEGKDGERGPKKAAIVLVALATGVGEQTVKRAAGSLRTPD